ncbi:MAG: hypothetical protein RIR63_1150 [Actinomycetota bacterium]
MTKHEAVLGRFFEDYVVGDIYQHPFGRTISQADNTWFTLLTCNTNQNHFNAEFAKSNPITGGRVIVNSGLTVAMVLGISVMDMSQNAVSNLGWTDIKLTHPMYEGDTLYAESICTDARESNYQHENPWLKSRWRRDHVLQANRNDCKAFIGHWAELLSPS